jgi:hypothetical protein
VFPEVKAGAPIDFFMFGKAIAEFEFTLVFADAPIDPATFVVGTRFMIWTGDGPEKIARPKPLPRTKDL